MKNNNKKLEDVVFPLFLRLSDLAETPEEIIDAIPVLIQREYSETATEVMELLREKLKIGKCLLLLDALDEVPTEHRKRLFEKLNRFAQRKSPCRMICTSRIVGYGGTFVAGVKEVEIVPFSQKQIEQYIETWFRNAAGYLNDDTVSASSLIRELRNKPQLGGLAQNPLLLSLICSLYQEKGLTLPARCCQVYEQAVRYMLGKWSKNRNPELNDAWIDAKTELLEELAYQFSCDGKEIFTLRELRKTIDKYLRSGNASSDFDNVSASHLISELSERDGILQKLHKDGDQYLFLHRTFQEYLTACYLKQASNGIALAREHFWEYEWHETLSLLAGLMENAIPFLQAITAQKDDIFSTLLLLAGRCIAECPDNSHPLTVGTIDRIYKLWQSYPNAGFIESVVVAIGKVNSLMFQRLRKTLSYPNWDVRKQVVRALSQISNPEAVEALIGVFKTPARKGGDLMIREIAASALAKIGNPQALELLIADLNSSNRFVREQAASILAKIGNPQALKILIADLNNLSIVSFTRWLTLLVVDGRVNPQAVEVLVTVLNDSENGLFRAWAASALAKIGNPQGVESLIAALNDSDSDIRQQAASALAEIGNPQGVKILIAALNDSDSDIRQQAALALAEIGNSQGVEILIAALNDYDSDVRRNVVKALGEIGISETLAQLIQLPEIDIYDPWIFPLARKLAVRFSKEKLPFIPVYPELVAHKQ